MSADDRTPRSHRGRAALGGASAGATLGLLVGLLLHAWPMVLLSVIVAGVLGAIVATVLDARFGIVEWEPGPGHSYVGARTPDDSFDQR